MTLAIQRVVIILFTISNVPMNTYAKMKLCRKKEGRSNHMNSLWTSSFPFSLESSLPPPSALCQGTVTIKETTREICIEGRVSYDQIVEAVGHSRVYQPAAGTISVNGHMIAGSGNIVLGEKVRYLYDFVTSYSINGTAYPTANESIVDHMLMASRGTIDSLCLDSYFQNTKEEWYRVSHDTYLLSNVDIDNLYNNEHVGLLFFGRFNCVLEYHTPLDEEPNSPLFNSLARFIMRVNNVAVGVFPSSLYGVLPVFALTGTTRLLVKGSYSTTDFPNPFIATDNLGTIEGVQIDTRWNTLVQAVEQGLFTEDKVPLYFNVVIKRIVAVGTNYKCWGEGTSMAAIDIEAPAGWGDRIDEFIDSVVYPALSVLGDVSIHFGKRIPPSSNIVSSALAFYNRCGVEIDLDIDSDSCFHPLCERQADPREFTYPKAYYQK